MFYSGIILIKKSPNKKRITSGQPNKKGTSDKKNSNPCNYTPKLVIINFFLQDNIHTKRSKLFILRGKMIQPGKVPAQNARYCDGCQVESEGIGSIILYSKIYNI